jgi:hypothetical protein
MNLVFKEEAILREKTTTEQEKRHIMTSKNYKN